MYSIFTLYVPTIYDTFKCSLLYLHAKNFMRVVCKEVGVHNTANIFKSRKILFQILGACYILKDKVARI